MWHRKCLWRVLCSCFTSVPNLNIVLAIIWLLWSILSVRSRHRSSGHEFNSTRTWPRTSLRNAPRRSKLIRWHVEVCSKFWFNKFSSSINCWSTNSFQSCFLIYSGCSSSAPNFATRIRLLLWRCRRHARTSIWTRWSLPWNSSRHSRSNSCRTHQHLAVPE